MARGIGPSRRALHAERQAESGGKRLYRGGRPRTRDYERVCPCGSKFTQRLGSYLGTWCGECVRHHWRPVWSRDSGEPMPASLQVLVERENACA
jgi:hypothetical protein